MNGFSDAQLRIIARDLVAPRNDGGELLLLDRRRDLLGWRLRQRWLGRCALGLRIGARGLRRRRRRTVCPEAALWPAPHPVGSRRGSARATGRTPPRLPRTANRRSANPAEICACLDSR